MPKIIVVDDDLTNVQLTKMLLEIEGFEVQECTNLTQAYAATTSDVDGFVVDVNLARGENGLDLLRAIRGGETAVSPTTPVIITSGDQRREDEALAAQASHFLLKPYAPERLSDLLTTHTERN